MSDDKMVVFQSKMLQAFLKAFGVTPTPEGLFNALPEDVRETVVAAYQQAHTVAPTIAALGENLPGLVAMIADTHRLQQENNALLRALLAERRQNVIDADTPASVAELPAPFGR